MIDTLITDLVRTSAGNIRRAAPRSIDEVRAAGALIAFSAPMAEQQQRLKQFLRRNLYQHFQVARMANKARRIVTDLFAAFEAEPRMLPPQFWPSPSGATVQRAIADYIAGMTDRYAIREHRRLFSVDLT